MDFDNANTDNTNSLLLLDPKYAKLANYVPSAAVYRCPADRSVIRVAGNRYSRIRSMAMNEAVGTYADGEHVRASAGWRVYRKMDDIKKPGPSSLWVFIEQHPDSIEDGRFALDCQDQGKAAHWIDFPANFHDRACSLSFADGHAELHAWVDKVTMPANRYCGCLAHYATAGVFESCPDSPDMAYLQERTSAKRD
jgi:prepilin-type processing-associated H-X9-DG protein